MVKIRSKRRSKAKKSASYDVHVPNRPDHQPPPVVAQGRYAFRPGPYQMQTPAAWGAGAGVHNPAASGVWDSRQQRQPQPFSPFFGYNMNMMQNELAYRQSLGGACGIPHGAWDQGGGVRTPTAFAEGTPFAGGSPPRPNLTTSKKQVKKRNKTKTFRKVPKCDWEGFHATTEPIRCGVKAPLFLVNPNMRTKNSLTTTKRGLYECFSGGKNRAAGAGAAPASNFHSPNSKPCYDIRSHLDVLLHHPTKTHYGKFLKAERFPDGMRVKVTRAGTHLFEKDEDFPGPGHYFGGGGGDATTPTTTTPLTRSYQKRNRTRARYRRAAAAAAAGARLASKDWKPAPAPVRDTRVGPQTSSWMFASKTRRDEHNSFVGSPY